MSAPLQATPVSLLLSLQESALRYARGLPLQVEVKTIWPGIGFRLGDLRLVSALDDIREVLTYPEVTRVPGAAAWVRGISNVRGNLLPVLDLAGHLGHGETRLTEDSRVLIVDLDEIFAGLLVDEVLGLKHFVADEDRENVVPDSHASLAAYLDGGFVRDKEYWGLFAMRRLVRAPAFLQVA
jgi:twitching motility protein PilI